jgi:hypothetical protein
VKITCRQMYKLDEARRHVTEIAEQVATRVLGGADVRTLKELRRAQEMIEVVIHQCRVIGVQKNTHGPKPSLLRLR